MAIMGVLNTLIHILVMSMVMYTAMELVSFLIDDLGALVGYLQDIYSINVDPIVPFEIRGVN